MRRRAAWRLAGLPATSASAGRTLWEMNSLISLQYPNGRVHDATLATEGELKPGQAFELHGRRWRAVELTKLPRGSAAKRRMLCLSGARLAASE